jgi:hypothetical protein
MTNKNFSKALDKAATAMEKQERSPKREITYFYDEAKAREAKKILSQVNGNFKDGYILPDSEGRWIIYNGKELDKNMRLHMSSWISGYLYAKYGEEV